MSFFDILLAYWIAIICICFIKWNILNHIVSNIRILVQKNIPLLNKIRLIVIKVIISITLANLLQTILNRKLTLVYFEGNFVRFKLFFLHFFHIILFYIFIINFYFLNYFLLLAHFIQLVPFNLLFVLKKHKRNQYYTRSIKNINAHVISRSGIYQISSCLNNTIAQ